MYEKSSIELGQVVQDRISGFKGVVTTVGFHISGCIRIGVSVMGDTDEPSQTPPSEKFFYPPQLRVQQEETEWTNLQPETEVGFDLGQQIRDRGTNVRGYVHVVNFSLFNCPQARIYERDDADGHWVDKTLAEEMDQAIASPGIDGQSQSTGACAEDSPSRDFSR